MVRSGSGGVDGSAPAGGYWSSRWPADHDADRMAEQLLVLDIETGAEPARVDTGSPLRSVVFPAPGFGRDVYHCAFPGVSRVAVAD